MPPELRAELARGRRAESLGDDADAIESFRRVVDAAPACVPAQRALQNLALADHRRGELLAQFGGALAAAPRSADAIYLYARLLHDRVRQRELFDRARTIDPSSPWPWLGVGAIELADGHSDRAVDVLRHAHELGPDVPEIELALLRALVADERDSIEVERLLEGVADAEPWDDDRVTLLAQLREKQGRPRDAIELLARSVARAPRNVASASRLLTLLRSDGTSADASRVVRELETRDAPAAVREILAHCHALLGDAPAALSVFSSLPRLSAVDHAVRRRLLVVSGGARPALEFESSRFAALALLGVSIDPFERACRLSSERDPDRVRLAQTFAEIGWLDESIALLRPLASGASDDGSANRFLIDLFAQRQLEVEMHSIAIAGYRRFERGERVDSLESLLRELGDAARRSIGSDLFLPAFPATFWPVGQLLDPVAARGPVAWFRAHGRLLVAGKRSGSPPELLLAPLIAFGPLGSNHESSVPIAFIDGTLIPGFVEHRGARFAGAAFHEFAWVDVAAVAEDTDRTLGFEARLGSERDRLLADPAERAESCSERLRVDEPAEVAAKLELRALDLWRQHDPAGDRSHLLAEALDAVVVHEVAHVEDVRRFLPLSDHWWRDLAAFAKLGFSPRRVEEWLELRAQCVALVRAENPYLVLASCFGQDDGDSPLTPHGGGYRELLTRCVQVLEKTPANHPTLDRTRVLLQQLDRLSADEIRAVARALLAELDIPA